MPLRPPPPPLPLPLLLCAMLALAASARPLAWSARSSTCPVKLPQDEPSADPSARRGATRPAPRIVNGDLIAPGLLPYLVALYHTSDPDSFFCTGTLVSSRWVLTAAHCGVTTASFARLLLARASDPGPARGIDAVFRHESYVADSTPGMRFDILAFRLAVDAPTDARRMSVNVNVGLPLPDTFARVAGFGVTRFNSTDTADQRYRLRQVDVPVVRNGDCGDRYRDFSPASQLCAGYLDDGGCDSCQGDSGGPLLQYDPDDNPVLVAIVSTGAGCAFPDSPGIYIRTAAFGDWMRDIPTFDFTAANETVPVFFEQSGLSTVAVVGIVAAAVAAVIVVALVAVAVMRRRNRAAPPPPTAAHALPPRPSQPAPGAAAQPAVPYLYSSMPAAPPDAPAHAGLSPPPPPPPPPAGHGGGSAPTAAMIYSDAPHGSRDAPGAGVSYDAAAPPSPPQPAYDAASAPTAGMIYSNAAPASPPQGAYDAPGAPGAGVSYDGAAPASPPQAAYDAASAPTAGMIYSNAAPASPPQGAYDGGSAPTAGMIYGDGAGTAGAHGYPDVAAGAYGGPAAPTAWTAHANMAGAGTPASGAATPVPPDAHGEGMAAYGAPPAGGAPPPPS